MDYSFTFRDPLWLLALLVVPWLAWVRHRRGAMVFVVPFVAAWHGAGPVRKSYWSVGLAVGGLALLTVALARPQRLQERWMSRSYGYDIMLAVDLSPSMLTEDYQRDGKRINRLEAIRPIIQAFIERRPADRIGIVLFAGKAYTLSPLTFDHAWLARQVDRIRIGLIDEGTAIGDGVVVALQRLAQPAREVSGKRLGGLVLLLTDGANNAGLFTPQEARAMAEERGVPVFTIAAGRRGLVPVPYVNGAGEKKYRLERSEIDEDALWLMALATGGKFFRGPDRRTLVEAFNAVSQLRPITFERRRLVQTEELFPWFAAPGVALMGVAGWLARRRRLT